jgi:PAS domain S-box-containing protein
MPELGGLETLSIMRKKCPDTPCLIVSGKIDEETAVTAMRGGARDYIMKDNLKRLGPAIERELQEAEVRKDRNRIGEKLEESEDKYRRIVETASEGIAMIQPDGTIDFVNAKFAGMVGEKVAALTGKQILDYIDNEYRQFGADRLMACDQETGESYEVKAHRQDGTPFWVNINSTPFYNARGRRIGNIGFFTDITEQKQLRDERERFTKRLIEVQEEERNRISRELHDDTAQWLALLTLEMDDVINRGKHLPEDTLTRLRKLRETTEKALQEVRRFSHELRPSVLEHFGLAAALELIVEESNVSDTLLKTETKLNIAGVEKRLPEEQELVLFRIAQESLSNIRKHAKATEACVNLNYSNSVVTLRVTDNGQGFDTRRKSVDSIGSGLGLVGMRERAQLIGGSLTVRSMPGKGTTVSIKVPVQNREN